MVLVHTQGITTSEKGLKWFLAYHETTVGDNSRVCSLLEPQISVTLMCLEALPFREDSKC